jgi:hypothetical protein
MAPCLADLPVDLKLTLKISDDVSPAAFRGVAG